MSGPAIIAGSSFNILAIIGRMAPVSFANMTETKRVIPTQIPTRASLPDINIVFNVINEDKIKPTIIAIRLSFHKTKSQSLGVISPVARPRIINVED